MLVHASKGMTRQKYEDVAELLAWHPGIYEQNIQIAPFEQLERGGIVGRVTINGCTTASKSPWFFGKFGFELRAAAPLPFAPIRGALGFFEVPAENI